MSTKIFVDGEAGTTGLQIRQRLAAMPGLEILHIPDALRKDPAERKRLLNAADLVFLCLPDAAAVEAVSLIENDRTRVIDASTAHRCDPAWAYGFPELSREMREKIRASKRVSVPGCYASGFAAAVFPLRSAGILGADYPVDVHAVSGYTGGGKKLIETYETGRSTDPDEDIALKSPRFYALTLKHKHIPEMTKISGLSQPPLFTPIVGDFSRGMLVSLPLHRRLLAKDIDAQGLHAFYSEYYATGGFVKVMPLAGEGCLDAGFLDATGCNGTNRLELYVFGEGDRLLVVARLDNLGKGASGAAVQCMNLMLGRQEDEGLSQ